MKTFISFFVLVLTTTISLAQNTSLTFSSTEGNFLVFIDEIKQTGTPSMYLRINNFDKTTCDVKIVFTDNDQAPVTTNLEFSAGGETHYIIKKEKEELKILWEKHLEHSTMLPIGEGQIEVNYIDKEGKEHLPPVKKEEYQGEKGCEHPISSGEVKQIHDDMHKFHYPDEKYKAATKWLKGKCITADNAAKIAHAFNKNAFYEEKFVVFVHNITYDLDNFDSVLNAVSEEAANNAKAKLGL